VRNLARRVCQLYVELEREADADLAA
jgi:hypothetical protein